MQYQSETNSLKYEHNEEYNSVIVFFLIAQLLACFQKA